MRIGLLAPPWAAVPPSTYGGTESMVAALAGALAAMGHDVVLFATADSRCPVTRRWVYDQAQAPMGRTPAEARQAVRGYQALRDCDIIHDHTLLGPLLTVEGPPAVTTIHSPFTPELRDLYRAAARRVPVIAISRSQRAEAPEIPVAAVIHHGIDPGAFPVGAGGGGYLMFLGRMAPEKGAHRAIDVARRVGRPLVIAAKMREPEERRYFDEWVQPQLGSGIEYAGEVGPEEKVALLGGADAFLNPIAWPEPFGLVMLEALACGTPVITFASGAAPEIIDSGRTGFLCRDEEDMAAAVERIGTLSRADCRSAVEGYFSAQRMARDYLALYRAVLAQPADGQTPPSSLERGLIEPGLIGSARRP